MIGLAALLAAAVTAPAQRPLVAAYYMGTGHPEAPAALPAERYDVLVWAFLTVCGTDASADAHQQARRDEDCGARRDSGIARPVGPRAAELDALRALKERNPGLRIVGSVGGWGMPYYPEMVADPARRRAFAASAAALVADGTVDGIDLDWEYPGGGDALRPELDDPSTARERADYSALVSELRVAIDRAASDAGRPRPLLTAAVAATPRRVAVMNWPLLGRKFDLVFAMTYDFTAGNALPGHHANLHATAQTGGNGADVQIARLIDAGLPAHKIMLGVPFYGREWTGASFSGPFPATALAGTQVENANNRWRMLSAERAAHPEGFGYDMQAEAPFFSRDGRFVTFADERSVAAARCFVRGHGLAGSFAWEATGDDGTLVAAMGEERPC